MNDLSRCKAVIIVFAMEGCGHCAEYQPRLEREIQRFKQSGAPLVYYNASGELSRGVIPVIVLDGASQDPQISALADQYRVQGMPTTLLLTHNARPVMLEGAIDDRQIYDLLVSAVWANR
jgi:thioredoxin-related protein